MSRVTESELSLLPSLCPSRSQKLGRLRYLSQESLVSPAAAAMSHQSCPTLCDPIDGSPPGSRPWESPGKNTGVGCHFFLQCMKVKSQSEVAQSCQLFTTPQTVTYQAPPSMGFSRQEYWSGVPLASPEMHPRFTVYSQLHIQSFQRNLLICHLKTHWVRSVFHCYDYLAAIFIPSLGTTNVML